MEVYSEVGGERDWKEVTTTATATVPPPLHNKVRQSQAESVWNCRSSLVPAAILPTCQNHHLLYPDAHQRVK